MIDAECRSEERFSRLSLAYSNENEKKDVNNSVELVVAQYSKKPEIHSTTISNNREVLVIEYHDDTHRESGKIFEEILHRLNIAKCV